MKLRKFIIYILCSAAASTANGAFQLNSGARCICTFYFTEYSIHIHHSHSNIERSQWMWKVGNKFKVNIKPKMRWKIEEQTKPSSSSSSSSSSKRNNKIQFDSFGTKRYGEIKYKYQHFFFVCVYVRLKVQCKAYYQLNLIEFIEMLHKLPLSEVQHGLQCCCFNGINWMVACIRWTIAIIILYYQCVYNCRNGCTDKMISLSPSAQMT